MTYDSYVLHLKFVIEERRESRELIAAWIEGVILANTLDMFVESVPIAVAPLFI